MWRVTREAWGEYEHQAVKPLDLEAEVSRFGAGSAAGDPMPGAG